MTSAFTGLTPELIWRHFESLTQIPRCSGNEAAAAQHVLDWAKSKGFAAVQDAAGNVVVRVPASPGKERAPTVVLQGHLDMVGEKDSSSAHDFAKDPIKVLREGEWITADGTTLGADNGIGLAASLAVAEDPDAVHGPLELLFTVDEETGLTGAQALAPGFVSGKTMLNLDSEEENALYVGCAGGTDTVIELPVKREARAAEQALLVRVSGFKGGHSGLDINTGRGNAVQLLALYLAKLRQSVDFALVSLTGGDKHNAIPREAEALVLLPPLRPASSTEAVSPPFALATSGAAHFREALGTIYGKSDPAGTLALELQTGQLELQALIPASRDALLDLLVALPHGVLAMSQEVAGLVETSTNLAVCKLQADKAFIQESSRSSVMPALAQVQARLFAVARLAGAEPRNKGGYPGWQPNMDSAVLKRAVAVHERLLGIKPAIKAIHAGLECGIIGEKSGGMDMISFGPHLEAPHSPSERMKIDTVPPFYSFLKALLADIAG